MRYNFKFSFGLLLLFFSCLATDIKQQEKIVSKVSIDLFFDKGDNQRKKIKTVHYYQKWEFNQSKEKYTPIGTIFSDTDDFYHQFNIRSISKKVDYDNHPNIEEYYQTIAFSVFEKQSFYQEMRKGLEGIRIEFTFHTIKTDTDLYQLQITANGERHIQFLNSAEAIQFELSSEILSIQDDEVKKLGANTL